MKIYIPTASCFNKIVTSKGDRSRQRDSYLKELVDNAFGIFHGSVSTEWTKRGLDLEETAVTKYRENHEMVSVEKLPFQVSADGTCGCYVDGAVGEDGLLEVKCPSYTNHKLYCKGRMLPTKYIQQVQGELYITGRWWCDFFSYYPGEKSFKVRVSRDEGFIYLLANEIKLFHSEMMAEIIRRKDGRLA